MIVSLNTQELIDYSSIYRRYYNKNICISIDSSKTNTAICVMNRNYNVLDVIEFNGSQEKDILFLIKEQRDVIRKIFDGAKILDGAIEDIITKKEETGEGKYSNGLKYHHARYVITAVFVSLICCFQDYFDLTLTLVSNQTWKHTILPKELNKRNVYKGSVEYVKEIYPKFTRGPKPDDICDAICIGEYMKIRNGNPSSNIIDIPDEVEMEFNPFKYVLFNEDTKIAENVGVEFNYNSNIEFSSNVRLIANRISEGQLGWTIVDINDVSLEDIYKFCKGNFSEHTTKFKVVVKRV